MTEGLEIDRRDEGPVSVVALRGSLDGHTFVHLERTLNELLGDGQSRLVIDLSDLQYVASAGVGVFINIRHQAQERGGCLLLVNPGEVVREVFDILGLQALFDIQSDLDRAIAAAASG